MVSPRLEKRALPILHDNFASDRVTTVNDKNLSDVVLPAMNQESNE